MSELEVNILLNFEKETDLLFMGSVSCKVDKSSILPAFS